MIPSVRWRKSSLKSVQLGDEARDRGDWVEAANHYRTYLQKYPKDAGIWVQLGHSLKEVGELDQADSAYLRALSIAPSVADTHLQIGHLEKVRGRPEVALGWYQRAVAINPSFQPAISEIRRYEDARSAAQASAQSTLGASMDSFSQRLTALEERFRHFDDFATAVRAIGIELQNLRRQSQSISERLTLVERGGAEQHSGLSKQLDGYEHRLAAMEDMSPSARRSLSTLFSHFQDFNGLNSEVVQHRAILEQLKKKLDVSS